MTEIIDYTKFRLNTKPFGIRIRRCPKCGRKGEALRYDDGTGRVFHTARRGLIGLTIGDHCMLTRGEAAQL